MRLLCRQTRIIDLRRCADMLTSDPMERVRYGNLRDQLPQVWMSLLHSGSLNSVVLEDTEPRESRIVGFGASVFVTDGFLEECKTPPLFWIGPELDRKSVV